MENTSAAMDAARTAASERGELARRLLARIKRAIRRNTSDGVRQLGVEIHEGAVLLRGRCTSFYCKQVAQEAARIHLRDGEQLHNKIEVAHLPR
jgi:osmotically-inducible protein OsmY